MKPESQQKNPAPGLMERPARSFRSIAWSEGDLESSRKAELLGFAKHGA